MIEKSMIRSILVLSLIATLAGCGATSHDPDQLELVVFTMVNNYRAENSVAELKWAEDMADAARRHSKDMIARDFFDHTNPDGLDVAGRLDNLGIEWIALAENIARTTTSTEEPAKAALNAWKESPVHEANMINATFEESGVGVGMGDDGYIYFTQIFIYREEPP
jgi:uncharacterized protein YkwD